MTLATMDEEEVSKVIVTDTIPANSKRGRNDKLVIICDSTRENHAYNYVYKMHLFTLLQLSHFLCMLYKFYKLYWIPNTISKSFID